MPWNDVATMVSGQMVTAAVWVDAITENMDFLEETSRNYVTGNVAVTATSEGTAGQVIATSPASISYETAVYEFLFHCQRLNRPAITVHMGLFDSTTLVEKIGEWDATGDDGFVSVVWRLAVTSGSHSYNIRAWLTSAGTATFEAGAGGPGNAGRMMFAVTPVPTE